MSANTNRIAEILQEGRDSGEMNFPGEVQSQAILFVLACKGALQYTRVHGPELFESTMTQVQRLLGCTAASGQDKNA